MSKNSAITQLKVISRHLARSLCVANEAGEIKTVAQLLNDIRNHVVSGGDGGSTGDVTIADQVNTLVQVNIDNAACNKEILDQLVTLNAMLCESYGDPAAIAMAEVALAKDAPNILLDDIPTVQPFEAAQIAMDADIEVKKEATAERVALRRDEMAKKYTKEAIAKNPVVAEVEAVEERDAFDATIQTTPTGRLDQR